MATLEELVHYLDVELKHNQIGDCPGAMNGLQLECSGPIERLACAVDANMRTIEMAIEQQADLLIVHHGIGWNHLCPVVGGRYQWLSAAIKNNLGIYSSHLPLDVHDLWGNNAVLARELQLPDLKPCFEVHGVCIGRRSSVFMKRSDLVQRLEHLQGSRVHCIAAGPDTTREIAIMTGDGSSFIHQLSAEGIDTFITGEARHWAFSAAHEYGLNLILGGHYATECFGVKTLGSHLADKYKLSSSFLDFPSGL